MSAETEDDLDNETPPDQAIDQPIEDEDEEVEDVDLDDDDLDDDLDEDDAEDLDESDGDADEESEGSEAVDEADTEDDQEPDDEDHESEELEAEAELDEDDDTEPDDVADADADEDIDPELDEDETVESEVDEPRVEAEETAEPEPTPERQPETATPKTSDADGGMWTTAQIRSVAVRAAAVLAVFALIGFGLGLTRGSEEIVRTEFVYTLDESVPDSFLREDRRLLTQVVTLTSDAVLGPVAERFDLTVDELRARINVQTVNLSEVLRLEVTDQDRQTALDISDAVVEQYLVVSSSAPTAEDNGTLRQRREDVLADLGGADAELVTAREADSRLASRQAELERRIDLEIERVARLRTLLDDAELAGGTAAQTGPLKIQLTAAENSLSDLREELDAVASERSEVGERSTTQRSLAREIERLEADLATIDQELARRELGPLVTSPVRELAEPTFETRSALVPGTRFAAAGILLGLPIAAFVAYRARRRQLWFG